MFRRYHDGAIAQSDLTLVKASMTIMRNKEKVYKMDSSSRNIVKFIATITFVALVIMAARFYAESQKEPMPAALEEQPVNAEKVVTPPAPEPQVLQPIDSPLPAGVGDEIPAITGEPSVNIAPSENNMEESSSSETGE
jgi:hypothetical protein